mmetsp:Transcript_31534/g.43035  ORF Transcript_31534/g.43035 Transcript_31534/m.43035 type:complete len:181 (-) Transcript_31534:1110-1652(-)
MKKLMCDSTAKILSENGRQDRAAIIDKLSNSIKQLQSLSESKLFIKTQELLKQERINQTIVVKPSVMSSPMTNSFKSGYLTPSSAIATNKRRSRQKGSRRRGVAAFASTTTTTSPIPSTTKLQGTAALLFEPTLVTVTCESDLLPIPLTITEAENNNRIFLEAIDKLIQQVDEMGKNLSQ